MTNKLGVNRAIPKPDFVKVLTYANGGTLEISTPTGDPYVNFVILGWNYDYTSSENNVDLIFGGLYVYDSQTNIGRSIRRIGNSKDLYAKAEPLKLKLVLNYSMVTVVVSTSNSHSISWSDSKDTTGFTKIA